MMEPVIVAHGEASAADPAEFSENRPSFFADPIAWLVAAAVERALDGVRLEPSAAGIVVMSDAAALPTSRVIAGEARRGRVSPLRFAGANPGILAGLSCVRWGLRGPSLVLAGAFPKVADTGFAVARGWLQDGHARHVVCATYRTAPADGHTAGCVVLGVPGGAT
ncbi:hypothetical protein [Nonomuraea sp. NPDC049480]|uniref:hypothetical protein n=1 Tax=Nonomuraea sp. NPDC049480 TaxID=3364353 RepID=UPI003799AEF4